VAAVRAREPRGKHIATKIHDNTRDHVTDANLRAVPALHIHRDDLTGVEVCALVREHLQGMSSLSPPESVHALGLAALRQPDITFWSAWLDGQLAGCAALKALDPDHGEIKSMRTVARHLRKGVAAAMLAHILAEARRRSYSRLSLETGAIEAFAPAHRLYARFGFRRCGPFASYPDNSFSVFMTKEL